MEQPYSTSKVTVEYFDPHGVYKLLAPGLIPRLPLRNLHWQSHAGPLRSIDTLHVELAPEGSVDPRPLFSPDPFFPSRERSESAVARDDGFQTQIGNGGATQSIDTTLEKTAGHRTNKPARRHQIPGLRRTPYLKVLFVRCDDNDAYKYKVRQEVREWIKTHTPGTSTKKKNTAENHDAFEWIVLHVVIPNTVAATQPPVTGKGDSGVAEKTSAVSKWRPGSSTLLEKLRSDFNSGSKSDVDHIAQIRIGINDVPYDSLPRVVPAVPSGYKETAEDNEAAWEDLMVKMRSLILSSFDMRVTQYEDDIKEKDNQRSLPGWNFCTFFILKEGLARGFESVGLVEDALVGYDELSNGGSLGTTASALLSFTDELKQSALKAQKLISESQEDDDEVVDMQATGAKASQADDTFDEIPINASKKPYRDLILENNVSVFDFRCYIFARQIALLLRLGNAWSTREELLAKLKEQQDSVIQGVAPRALPPKHTENESENLSMLAEICRRTLEFIPSVSQVMRSDVQAALAKEAKPEDDSQEAPSIDTATAEVIDNLVASYAFSIAQQVLAQTSTKALPIPPSTLATPDGPEQKATIPEPKTMMHPARESSLRVSTSGAGSGRPPPSPIYFPGPGAGRAQSEHEVAKHNAFLKVGLEELAARRAELHTLSRNILEECGKKRGWSDGWASVPVVGQSSLVDMVEINLDDDSPSVPEGQQTSTETVVSLAGIESKLLRAALDNSEDFYRLYESLTDKALRHYTVSNHTHSVQASMADLAVLKYHMRDYAAAASFFYRTTPFFGESGWSLLELSMLVMYSDCLKQLQRKDEYIKVVLKLLSKAASAERERQHQRSSFRIGKKEDEKPEYPDSDAIKGFLGDLLPETKTIANEARVPLANLFYGIEVDATPEYHDGRDSFSILVKATSLLVDELPIEKAKMRMIGHVGGTQREIWLELIDPVVIKPGRNRLKLDSKVVIPGTYDVDKIDFIASNLFLHYERDISQPLASGDFLRSPRITIYHRANTLDARLAAASTVQLDRNNSVDVEFDSGWNELIKAEVRVKAATSGLRLLTAEGKCIQSADTEYKFAQKPEGGLFKFDQLPKHAAFKIQFPFTVEQEVLNVSVRIEVTYTTEHGTYLFSVTPSVPVSLALGVNVQDVFKHNTLFSRFTVSTASHSPLRLFKSELVNSDIFESHFGLPMDQAVVVFPKQPASLLYKVIRKTGVKITKTTSKTLYLKLQYSIIHDEIINLVKESITQSLADSPLEPYSRLVCDTVIPRVRNQLNAQTLERVTLIGGFPTDFLSDVNWARSFAGLGKDSEGKDLSGTLASCIQTWQSAHPSLALPQEAPAEPRSILIPVDIPPVTIVHTADISLHPNDAAAELRQGPRSEIAAVVTNQLVPATLHLKWTRIWDIATPIANMSDMEFSYEVLAPGDAWLVGGRRKGAFPPTNDDELSSTDATEADIPLLLIPQREGWLPYPTLDIREVRLVPGEAGGSGALTPVDGPGGQPCEIDLRNLGETVRVIDDRERVTLSLDASGPGGGPLILETVRRGLTERVVA
ncbi:Trafficking protein particle complex subunit 10 [Apiospora phragmitis]|uniref:Trafficking protein particle complex subunit 10 n=1 Tax=Apiospora phragmitis TaxID=2905665 RepID=A0ABR1TTW8_9PEZI